MGGMVKQYQVVIDPQKLKIYGVPLAHVNRAIKQANQETGASVIEMAEAEYMVRATGYIKNIEDLNNVPLGSTVNGVPLLLSDVARVVVGPKNRRGVADLNGYGESVGGIVVMRFGENAQKVINSVKDKLTQLQKSLPQGVELVTVYDRSGLIDSAVDHLWYKLLEEMFIVAAVCLVFLFHFKSSLVVVVSLPLGILMAYSVMYFQGITANIMSLGGIAIAIGAMVDGAIVLIENLHKHMEKTPMTKDNRWRLVVQSAQEVGPALFFSLLIITVSFLPVFTLHAQEGRLFMPLAYTKTYAMAAAALLAITVVPVLMGYFVRGHVMAEQRNPINRFLVSIYSPLLTKVLRRPVVIILLSILLLASVIYPIKKIGSEFIPALDEGDLMYMPTTYPGISVGKARQLLQQTHRLIKTVPEVETVFGKMGRADTATDPAPMHMMESIIQLKPRSQWRKGLTKVALKKELDALVQLPGLTNAWVEPIKTRIDMLASGIKTPLGIKISGPNLSVIEDIGEQLESLLNGLKATASIYSEKVAAGRYINIDIQRHNVARYGSNIAEIQSIINSAIGGMTVTETTEGIERYSVNLRYPQYYRDSLDKLYKLPIITNNNKHVVLADVADISIALGPSGIKSENARLIGWSLIDVEGGDIGGYIEQANRVIEQQLKLPVGYSVHWSGQFESMQRAKEKLQYIIPLTLMIIVILLFLNFGRLSEVLIIALTVPVSVVGGLWLMYALAYDFSVAVAVGFIALAGVAVEVAVIMLTYLNQAVNDQKQRCIREKKSMNAQHLRSAIINGAVRRVRPVMMTGVSVIVGLLPILSTKGTGSEVMSRIAAPMVGGMLTAMLVVLFVVPVVYFIQQLRILDK